MKKQGLFLIVVAISGICLFSCTTSKTVVSNSADLDKYEYASITDVMNYNGSASLMDLEVRVYDALESTRLTMIGEFAFGILASNNSSTLGRP